MGTAALIIFLVSLGLGLLAIVVVAVSGLRIYRTVRYAYKDSQPWMALFKEYAETLTATAKAMDERIQDISATGREIRETVDDIHDSVDELRSHPILKTARFVGRRRR